MASTFGSFSIALSALQYNRSGLDVAAGNIANAGTAGYSRRVLVGETVGLTVGAAVWSRSDQAGAGVRVGAVQRSVDVFLDARSRVENGRLASVEVRAGVLERIERAVGEPSESGLQEALSQMWSAWSTLAQDPDGDAARQQVLAAASSVASGLNGLARAVDQEWTSHRAGLDAAVSEVNTAASAVADLNRDIRLATASGTDTNTLLDQRDLLLGELAALTGATVTFNDDATADVVVDGVALVTGQDAFAMTVTGSADMAGSDPVGVQIGGSPVALTGGVTGGAVQALTSVLPGLRDGLDVVAVSVAGAVNAVHSGGYDRSGTLGGDFFTGTTAGTIAVAVTDLDRVAANGSPTSLDGANAAALAALAETADGPDQAYRTFVSGLATDAAATNRSVLTQATLVGSVDGARMSLSGVDTDEEMVLLVAHQRAYEAAARVMTTLDAVLDTLINRTGSGR